MLTRFLSVDIQRPPLLYIHITNNMSKSITSLDTKTDNKQRKLWIAGGVFGGVLLALYAFSGSSTPEAAHVKAARVTKVDICDSMMLTASSLEFTSGCRCAHRKAHGYRHSHST